MAFDITSLQQFAQGSQQGSGIEDILKRLKTSNPLIDIGSKFAGGLFGLLSGKSQQEKNRESLFGDLERLKGRPAIDPSSIDQFLPQIEESLKPLLERLGKSRATKVGTGSGVGIGEVLRQSQGQFGGQLLEIMRQIQQINAQRPLQIAQAQSRLV